MPEDIEDREKCLEKLNQMQKYIPFLDFMIEKIEKKKTEISLECQLSKFQALRSVIVERNGNYSWDAIVKVENVIEKLISKLDFKEQYEKFKEDLNSHNNKINMATSISSVPSSATTAVTAPTGSSSQSTTACLKSHDFSSNTVDLIMKTLKISVDNSLNKERGKEFLGSNQALNDCDKTMETDLDKDLDGFDLTDCSNLSEIDSSITALESVPVASEKASSHDDLLSSSREKLLKSLQNRLYPSKVCQPSSLSSISKTEKPSESKSFYALSHSQSELKPFLEKSEHTKDMPVKTHDKKVVLGAKSVLSLSSSEKSQSEPGDINLKQKLKEKLSTDICEVYRVPGKSVGGSLRSLKESKDSKKNVIAKEVELFTPNKISDVDTTSHKEAPQSKSSTDRKSDKWHRRSGDKKEEKSSDWVSNKHNALSSNSRKHDNKSSKTSQSKSYKPSLSHEKKSESNTKKDGRSLVLNKKGDKHFGLDKLNDDELLGFVKENMSSLPHLSKLTPEELRKIVQSSLFVPLDADAISEISDDSFEDLDDFLAKGKKLESKSKPHPLASVKISQVGLDGVAKNVKPIVERNEGEKNLEEVGDKTHEIDDVSLDEEDYALKLIEETTPITFPPVKKKGLLELPMPLTDDLFDDISSIESFETSSPSDTRNLKLTKLLSFSETKTKPDKNKSEIKADLNKAAGVLSLVGRANPQPLKDPNNDPRLQTGFVSSSTPTDNCKVVHRSHENSDPRIKPFPGFAAQEVRQFSQFGTKYPNEIVKNTSSYVKPQFNPISKNDPRLHSYSSSEPKSYAEYKRMKLREQARLKQKEEFDRGSLKGFNSSEPRAPVEKDDVERNKLKKTHDSLPSKCLVLNQPTSKSTNPVRTHQARKNNEPSKQFKHCKDVKNRSRQVRSHQGNVRKEEDRRQSFDSEDLVSPLDELYRNDSKPQTGRGYGIQRFKIPKKVRTPDPVKINKNPVNTATKEIQISNSDSTKEDLKITQVKEPETETEISKESTKIQQTINTPDLEISQIHSTPIKDVKSREGIYSSVDCTKTDSIITDKISETCDSNKKIINAKNESGNYAEVGNDKTDVLLQTSNDAEEQTVNTIEPKTVKKCEAQVVECDSSMESLSWTEQSPSTTPSDRSSVVAKEEITQEFVESLIRKSFQSGEGKLLLAQVKLFEEFARKLNSKKLKTIQKIINSDSDSSSSSESTSEDEKKKRRSKKSEEKSQKSKKRKKKIKNKRKRKLLTSSSSSSSESEETSEEENYDKKEDKSKTKKNETSVGSVMPDSEESKMLETPTTSEGTSLKTNELLKAETKKKRRNLNFSGRKNRRQKQKKLLEKILNEGDNNDSNTENTSDVFAKESEPKTKPKPKGKVKTELDRLHEDIRRMFICEGVLTATGQRMCRILKQSGGNMNNLDIVKESAKMVEEEKLKKVQTRMSTRNSRSTTVGESPENRSRSQSLDKGTKASVNLTETDSEDSKLELQPYVVLQRVNLDNFGYGVKISEGCISFSRMRGRNTAIRGAALAVVPQPSSESHSDSALARNVFLFRNKRKVQRMKDGKGRKVYRGKKLIDIVKNLPLKMAKMNHLQICEKKPDGAKKKKGVPEKLSKKSSTQRKALRKIDLSNEQLRLYTFEKKRKIYSCKVCFESSRNITGHYKEVHPEHEVVISRLSIDEAKKAITEARNYGYELLDDNNTSAAKCKLRTVLRRFTTYNCRMCSTCRIPDLNTFATHTSSHTGEYRFLCPEEDCEVQVFSREDMRVHILSSHPKNRYDYYNKVTVLYSLSVEENNLFGFLCSECNFVQVHRRNLENHILTQHESSESAQIIRINMSSKKLGIKRKKSQNRKSDVKDSTCSDSGTARVEQTEKVYDGPGETRSLAEKSTVNDDAGNGKQTEPLNKAQSSEDVSVNPQNSQVETKKIFIDENVELEKGSDGFLYDEEPTDPLGADDDVEEINLEDDSSNDIDMEDCVDLNNVSAVKASDAIDPVETSTEKRDPCKISSSVGRSFGNINVGPLEAKLLSSSEILYECYVKGCLFSTQSYDIFKKHITISHWRTKWNGTCDICPNKDCYLRRETAYQLLKALEHLKLHEQAMINKGKDESLMELKICSPSEECVTEEEESEKSKNMGKAKGDSKMQTKTETSETSETSETPYPVKPLLRVRNFLGDRLSTPKESEVVATPQEELHISEVSNSSTMFTIENVRSLKEVAPEETEIRIEQVRSLKDCVPNSKLQTSPAKTILVRSCPTRKIAIRPEASGLAVDVGQPSVGHPVVLSPLSSNSPIRIISTSASSKPQFPIKPIVVSTSNAHLNSPTLVPVYVPAIITTTILPTTSKPESSETESESKPSEDIEVITPRAASKTPPPSAAPTIHQMTDNSSDGGESGTVETMLEGGDDGKPQRMYPSGKKSVKDARIYEEMLTKAKLCHLFKCMGIECSFTCNSEKVFTQHIGLHDAQRRLKKTRVMKQIYIKCGNISRKASYWQQCAYCCEVLCNTNNALSQHILLEHGHCVYQCAFCFYRAVSPSYVEIHQNLAHWKILETSPRVIYKCKPLKMPPSQAEAIEKHGKKQSVRPFQCDQCGRKFYITQEFTNHLATEHQSVTAYTCHICKNLCFKVNRLINHYKLHSYSTYQCPYCLHGTETEKEMVFHLCSFHFSQPPLMYVRALDLGESGVGKQKLRKKKKSLTNQLDSLKVVVYESETVSPDCIVEADPEEEITENDDESLEISEIAAELGINPDSQSSSTDVVQELASIEDNNTKNLTVKTLLPNAQFSTENESETENCSVLISSGLSIPSDKSGDEEMNIPLGQLPLEEVSVQTNELEPATSPKNTLGSPNRNTKESSANNQQKELPITAVKSSTVSAAVHKLPPVVLPRCSKGSNSSVVRKKSVEQMQIEGESLQKNSENVGKQKSSSEENNLQTQSLPDMEGYVETENSLSEKVAESEKEKTKEPLIMNVVSLSKSDFDGEKSEEPADPLEILHCIPKDSSQPEPITKSSILPPIIRVEDFRIDEETKSNENIPKEKAEDNAKGGEKSVKTECSCPNSPDIIILDQEKSKSIVTVTLDSDDEKDPDNTSKPYAVLSSKIDAEGDKIIRKEIEMLRKQISSETDSLLCDEDESKKSSGSLSLIVQAGDQKTEKKTEGALLSPIEEAICSLNKKLQSETEEQHRKEEEEKKGMADVNGKKPISSEVSERPRTRFGARERRKEVSENTEKSDGDEAANPSKSKKFKEELAGKELYICGNEKCSYGADTDALLRDHLFVCDLSRESSFLMCPHCNRQIKHVHAYLDHLKYHGEKKFYCGLCPFTTAVELSIQRHVKQKHKCSVLKIIPKKSKEGHSLYYPKNFKVDKIDFEVNGYSPGDEDKLPLQSVYQVNVKCAKCPYFTKVRSNMVRHLKIHVKSVETEGVVVVPSTAPTNPVPCLETKERMFDKMTNLAASSQLAQAKEKTALENLSPEEEAKLPQFIAEQLRYKCCASDCNYITVDDGMLKHHIKALHDDFTYYSCPHCKDTVHVDVRHVPLDKIGHHLKHHDIKLYKCAHCIYFHFQKNVVEKHTLEKHPDRRFYVHTVREPKLETSAEEPPSSSDTGQRVWRCGLCNELRTLSKSTLMDHLLKIHNTKSKYKCQLCPMKGNSYQMFLNHFSSKHPGEKTAYQKVYYSDKAGSNALDAQSGNSSGADSSNEHFDTTPLWQRGAPRIRHIRGILIEEEEIKTKKTKRTSLDESESDLSETPQQIQNAFYCPLCVNKKKPFYTRNEDCFRSHLYQELNYQQYACILCGKMFVDKRDFERHHARIHLDKPKSLKQTKEDSEIKFWVDQVIAKRKKQMEEKKRKLSDSEASGSQVPHKKKKEV